MRKIGMKRIAEVRSEIGLVTEEGNMIV
jgi:hypothetical protein